MPRLAVLPPLACALWALAPQGSAAWAQTPPAAAPADPAFEASKRAFESLAEADRRAIQDALIWSGDYKGVVDGGFGRGTRAAIVAYARRNGGGDDGRLDAKIRAALLAAAAAAKTAIGFAPALDARSGVAVALPAKLLPKKADTKTGARWSAADNSIVFETTRTNESDGDLPSRFDRLKDSTPARRVTYRVLRPDFFVISGEAGKSGFYIRQARGLVDGVAVLRGYALTYPLASKPMQNAAVAIANSFDPFPASPPSAASSPGVAAAPAVAKPAIAATAVALAPDRFVAPALACDSPRIGDQPARLVKRDEAAGLAMYEARVPGARPLGSAGATADAGAEIIVLFQEVDDASMTTPSRLTMASGEMLGASSAPRVLAPLGETAAGGVVFDRAGGMVGLVGARKAPTRVAGVTPQAAWPTVSAAAVARFMAPAHGAAPARAAGESAESRAAADIAVSAAASIAALSCNR